MKEDIDMNGLVSEFGQPKKKTNILAAFVLLPVYIHIRLLYFAAFWIPMPVYEVWASEDNARSFARDIRFLCLAYLNAALFYFLPWWLVLIASAIIFIVNLLLVNPMVKRYLKKKGESV